mmetsp:Transcript_894/g.538  ORF Transcript_894/g.538 Transcript_894/m.538 type:complete len:87 (-) Transcript_894:38-298(-)
MALITLICFVKLQYLTQHEGPVGTFRAPLSPFTPCMAIISNNLILSKTPLNIWLASAVVGVVGLLIYLLYGQRNSKLQVEQEEERY